jgi:membrane-associated phospholipid phosphatase
VVSDVLRPVRAVEGTGRARLLLAALACLLGLGLICVVFVWTPAGQRLDQWLLPQTGRGSVLFGPAKALLSFAGDPIVLIALLAGVLVTGALSDRIRVALAGTAVVGCSIAGARVLKMLVSRPDLDVAGSTTHNSFPSGHVAAATGLVFAVLLMLPVRARWWCAVPGAAAVAAVGAATMIAGWHRLSDVVGAVFLAGALDCVAVWSADERRRGM